MHAPCTPLLVHTPCTPTHTPRAPHAHPTHTVQALHFDSDYEGLSEAWDEDDARGWVMGFDDPSMVQLLRLYPCPYPCPYP